MWGFADPFSSVTHLMAAVAALVGAYFLIEKGRGNPVRVFALVVYSFCMVFLFSMSGVYHLLERESLARAVLQRLDHSAIWLMIAGTFTPIHMILFRKASRWVVLLFIWTVAIVGLVLEVVFFHQFPEWLLITLFMAFGWMGFVSHMKFRECYKGHSPALIPMGGLLYSIGAVMEFTRWPNISIYLGPHDFFHIFVMLGAYSHWRFIYKWSNHPISQRIFAHIKTYPDGVHLLSLTNDRLEITGSRLEKCSLVGNSIEELKKQVLEQIKKRYHHKEGFHLILRYFSEEEIKISQAPVQNNPLQG